MLYSRQFGTNSQDSLGVSLVSTEVDGNIYFVDSTLGVITGRLNNNLSAVFLRIYSVNEEFKFSRKIQPDNNDFGLGGGIDASNGDVVVAGETQGNITGSYVGTSAGGEDIFLHVFNADGTTRFRRLFGRTENDIVRNLIPTSDGRILVSGSSEASVVDTSNGGNDLVLRKYDSKGSVVFSRQVGSEASEIIARSIV